jgi:class 3 adenylate cyclase
MRKTLNSLHAYFIPHEYHLDEQVYRKSKILVNTSFITTFFAISFLFLAFTFGQHMAAYGLVICGAGFLSIPWLLRSGLGRSVCANIFVALAFISTIWDVYWYKGLESPEVWWLCMTPVVAIFLDTMKSAWWWLALSLIASVFIGMANVSGHYFNEQLNPEFLNWALFTSNLGLIALMTIIAMVMESAYVVSMQRLHEKNIIIEAEKHRSDELLLNILPAEVMEELKETGKTTARNYDLVSVLFIDIKDFTSIAENMTPEDLVSGIDEYFETFDRIVEKYDVEKIKTVGDAYICVSGLPAANSNNPVIIVDLALEMAEAVQELIHKRAAIGEVTFEVRLGVHSGPVVAGVVGVKKFAYDIWGDTVNMAARMQQHGAPGKVNISGTTHDLVKHRFTCTHRGLMQAKHKGMVDMYFVEGRKHLAANERQGVVI